MTKPKKYPYQIQYIDNTYRMVDWTKTEWEAIGDAMVDGIKAIRLEEGIFVLKDIRAIVSIPEIEEETIEEGKENENLTEWGFVDRDTANWLRANGIDVSEVAKGGTN